MARKKKLKQIALFAPELQNWGNHLKCLLIGTAVVKIIGDLPILVTK